MTADFKPKTFLTLFGVGFLLNLVWELLQMPLYTNLSEFGYLLGITFCSLASIIDAVTILIIFVVLEVTFGVSNLLYYLGAALLGAAIAVFFELFALETGLWSYEQSMPAVPELDIAVLPIVQLTILVPLSIFLANKVRDRS
ncbi:MAG: hypothetical protein DWQ47_11795 [Acidobacteria bacterium]|nr:MAG: hypothetical protein DWQ32_14210 [Acidobacteriota bacterium]REJ98254.1 MAG: hypothetical protein DWQ38_17010 [Acidobacteriota bacterium]REK16998.1 MAG: hypothetical protein DWQ43_02055 [Acidobacteriota bacterium]REK42908.1 MAG: hypothetical protein DWQ47_11795 [Acidobacteriota bacterium]